MTQGNNFSERARRVLQRTHEESRALCNEYIGTEHLLLSLLREPDGVTQAILEAKGIDGAKVAQRVKAQTSRGKSASPDGDLPFTSRAKRVLELSLAEARTLGHSYVGTEHLLLGLLAEEKGIAAQVLAFEFGLNLDIVRAETLRVLGSPAHASVRELGHVPRQLAIVSLQVRFNDGRTEMRTFHDAQTAIEYLQRCQ